MLVGCIVFLSHHFPSRVAEGDAFLFKKRPQLVKAESLVSLIHESVLVSEIHESEYAPHVIYEIRVIEFHRPFLFFWRESAAHQ